MQVDSTQSPNRHAWKRWALRFGLPSAVVALCSVWLYEPDTQAGAIVAVGFAVVALFVFVLTMPRRRTVDRPRRARGSSPDGPA